MAAIEHLQNKEGLSVNTSTKVVFLQNQDHEIIYMNEGGLRYFAKERDNVLGKTCFSLYGSPVPCKNCPRATVSERKTDFTSKHFNHQGHECFDLTAVPIFDEKQRLSYTLISFRTFLSGGLPEEPSWGVQDVSPLILDHLPYACILSDANSNVTYWNKAVKTILGCSAPGEIRQRLYSSFPSPDDHSQFSAINARLRADGETAHYQSRHVVRHGQEIVCNWVDIPLLSDEQKVKGFLSIAQDVTEQDIYQKKLIFQATHDTLTELPNRSWFRSHSADQVVAAEQNNDSFAIVLLELNHFKDVNTSFGTLVGDRLLKNLATRLKANFPFYPLARLGGDEFAFILRGYHRQEDISKNVHNILKVVSAPFFLNGSEIEITASVGIACYPDHGTDQVSLMSKVNIALSLAKEDLHGIHFYDNDLDLSTCDRLPLMSQLRHAIDLDQLELEYQPKISLQDHRLMGFEALVRWQHPQLGRLMPNRFLAYAETSELIEPLTQKILELGLKHWCKMNDAGHAVPIAINLSARLLGDKDFPDLLGRLIEQYHFPPQQLEIELTETAIISDPLLAGSILQRISELGVSISVDDYGTGFSSLTLLKRLPINKLKIDMTFIRNMLDCEQDAIIVKSTINMAHDLGLLVIAEGIEDEATMQVLSDLGCDEGQGFYIAKPLPAIETKCWQFGR